MKNLRYELFDKGIFIDPMVDRSKLQSFISKLWPVSTPVPLIRIGDEADGGYLVPDDLEGIRHCYSPGVSDVASFENDLLERGINSHLADYSVDAPPDGLEAASFTKKFLGGLDIDQFMTLRHWMESTGGQPDGSDLLLQMDIEGYEYEVLLSTPIELLRRFRIIVIEFHNIETWAQKDFFNLVQAGIGKLLSEFHVVHNHPNNCCATVNLGGVTAPRVIEMTFLRKDRADATGFATAFPHPLDRMNVPGSDLVLPANWHA